MKGGMKKTISNFLLKFGSGKDYRSHLRNVHAQNLSRKPSITSVKFALRQEKRGFSWISRELLRK
jgi:hypothetical protein